MSSRAVLALDARAGRAGAARRHEPPVRRRSCPATMVGCTRTPPLAMVAYTLAICTAVTATPWPKASV